MKKTFSALKPINIILATASLTTTIFIGLLAATSLESTAQQTPTQQQSGDLQEAKRLDEEVSKLYQQGKYKEAILLAQRSLSIYEKALGPDHPDVATSLNNLGLLYQSQGNYSAAEPLLKRSLSIREKALSPNHPDVAQNLNSLAELYRTQGNYSAAEPLLKRSLSIREKALGPDHPDVATSLNNLSALYNDQGNYSAAEPLLKRSLSIYEKALGPDHPSVATSLNNLALLYQSQGNYSAAEPLYKRSFSILEKALGPDHPDVAQSLKNLAVLYREQGNYSAAEPLFKRSLSILEKALSPNHPDVAQNLNSLAILYASQGNYSAAEPLYKRSLSILEKALGPDHPLVAQSLNNLAELYREQENNSAAEPLYKRSLSVSEKALGPDHPNVATSLDNLALLYNSQDNYSAAEPLFKRSLLIREKALGPDHPDVAISLNNLAGLYNSQGNYSAAEPLFKRSLSILEKALGSDHPNVEQSLSNLALLYQLQNNIPLTIDYLTRSLTVEEKNLKLIFAVGDEQRKQDYASQFTGATYSIISLALTDGKNNQAAQDLALTTVLQRKGLVLDAVTDSIQILLKQEKNPEVKQLINDWREISRQLSQAVYTEQKNQTDSQRQANLQELENKKRELEEKITNKSSAFRTATEAVTIAKVQSQIPADAALVEIVQYLPFNTKYKKYSERWGKPRYAVAVLRNQGKAQWVDLGDASDIDVNVKEFRNSLVNARSLGYKKVGNSSYQKLLQPILSKVGNAQHILLSPDGQLTQIPFEALIDDQGKFLIENYQFSYLTTGRDLLRFVPGNNQTSSPLLIGGVDYNQLGVLPKNQTTASSRGSNKRSTDIDSLEFSLLDGTLPEIKAIKKLQPNSQILSGTSATEEAVKQISAPSILHLATHGFFLADKPVVNTPEISGIQEDKKPRNINIENPLLRSGIALAGSNQRGSIKDRDDGILTAQEFAAINLRGTKLVVLSACESGKGDIRIGQGVYGLRRALTIAGSESQVMSLWVVDDEGTQKLMVEYYQNLNKGMGRHEALRQAQLKFIGNGIELSEGKKSQHPYYWAAFVPSGNWSALR